MLTRLLIPTLAVAAPTLLLLVVMAATRILSPGTAFLGAAAVFLALLLILRPVVHGFERLREIVEGLMEDTEEPDGEESVHHPATDNLSHSLIRLARRWRRRLHETEDALAATETILSSLPDPLILFDDRRRIVRANKAALSVLGSNLLGRDLAVALRNPAVLDAADAVLRGEAGGAVEFSQAVPVNRDLRAHIVPLPSLGPEGARAVLTLQDLTASKRSERMRADFAANASHELRTPLATLLGFIETLRGPARDDSEAQTRFLRIMHEQATRMARLVEDLLSLSRIEMNEHVAPSERVDLAELVTSVVDGLELRAEARRMTIVLDVEPDLPEIVGESDELAQVFQNLIDNAIKYGRGGTPITVGVRRVNGGEGEGYERDVVVSVRDQGEGIEAQHLPRLTERFYRVDTARSREMGGTGLGLAIVKHIVARHRGTLEIESEPGKGSVFSVRLHSAG